MSNHPDVQVKGARASNAIIRVIGRTGRQRTLSNCLLTSTSKLLVYKTSASTWLVGDMPMANMQYPGKAITDRYPSRTLCGKRLDNNEAFAGMSYGLPHTCFEDIVLVPLASWIFYLALVGFFFIALRLHSSRRGGKLASSPLHRLVFRKSQGGATPSFAHRWSKTTSTFSIIYMLLVLATILMNVLEIVRLYLADRGAGLLPFTLASLVIIFLMMLIPMPRILHKAASATILVFYVFALIFTSVKLATLGKLAGPEPRAATEYLNSDQQIDVGVIVGLYALSLLVEAYRLMRLLRTSKAGSATSMDDARLTTHDQMKS